jgi:RNA polymerase sigma factor (sigma-70 family)
MSGFEGEPLGRFATTQWSLVVAAADAASPDAERALADLCRQYWQPIYSYVRRRGADRERARDLTQGFFSTLLEKGYVKQADRERGRFRTFLLTALTHYLANEWDRSQALKRGGGRPQISLDDAEAERTYEFEPVENATPEKIFDRRWARTLLRLSFERLNGEMSSPRQVRRLETLGPMIAGDRTAGYRDVARSLGMSESAARVWVHRLRRRYRNILREEVGRTVRDPSQVDDELRHLLAMVS